jgi:hypothetical protein
MLSPSHCAEIGLSPVPDLEPLRLPIVLVPHS